MRESRLLIGKGSRTALSSSSPSAMVVQVQLDISFAHHVDGPNTGSPAETDPQRYPKVSAYFHCPRPYGDYQDGLSKVLCNSKLIRGS
jgi:hypothetical protein